MSIVVESISTLGSSTNLASVTINAPSGIQEGDLLVVSLVGYNNGGTASFSTASGWTLATGNNASLSESTFFSIQYKVATVADESASTFAFVGSGAPRAMRGRIFRLSNYAPSATLGAAATETGAATGTAFSSSPSSYTPISSGAFVLTQYGALRTTAVTTSGYTAPNVSFTELFDEQVTFSGNAVLASAYGIQDPVAAINSYTATFSASTTNHRGQIAIFQTPNNVTVANNLTAVSASAFSQGVFAESTVGSTLTTTNTTTFTQNGTGTAPTQWANEPKANTTWINEEL